MTDTLDTFYQLMDLEDLEQKLTSLVQTEDIAWIASRKNFNVEKERALIHKAANSITKKGQRLVSLTQKLQTVADSRILMSK
jgi:hypothetical protein